MVMISMVTHRIWGLQLCPHHWTWPHTLRKYDLAEHFKARKPDYVTEWVHEMLWGKGLRQIAKRGIELVQEARQKHGDQARINLHLAWFGNELVGENGIAQNPNWPYDGPNGHRPDLMADSLRHLRWLKDLAARSWMCAVPEIKIASRPMECS